MTLGSRIKLAVILSVSIYSYCTLAQDYDSQDSEPIHEESSIEEVSESTTLSAPVGGLIIDDEIGDENVHEEAESYEDDEVMVAHMGQGLAIVHDTEAKGELGA